MQRLKSSHQMDVQPRKPAPTMGRTSPRQATPKCDPPKSRNHCAAVLARCRTPRVGTMEGTASSLFARKSAPMLRGYAGEPWLSMWRASGASRISSPPGCGVEGAADLELGTAPPFRIGVETPSVLRRSAAGSAFDHHVAQANLQARHQTTGNMSFRLHRTDHVR